MITIPPRKGPFNLNRAQVIDENFTAVMEQLIKDGVDESINAQLPETMTDEDAVGIFESMMISRHMDIMARKLRAEEEGFYTIGSSGHEIMAALGFLTRTTDVAFLHYRDGGFVVERARKFPEMDIIKDTMLSFTASSHDPISGGRHKVWGSVPMNIPPQTSTIASHLPKAVGAAMTFERAYAMHVENQMPRDSVVICTFGDASVSHASAQTALNAAARFAHERLPLRVLFVCEDNGIGISVHTPENWIENNYKNRHSISYFKANGLDIFDTCLVAEKAINHCRTRKLPTFLHIKLVRLLGHAGSDPERNYHSVDQIEKTEALDPVLQVGYQMITSGILSPREILDKYESIRTQIHKASDDAKKTPKLTSAEKIIEPLAPYSPDLVGKEASLSPSKDERIELFKGEDNLPENLPARHMAYLINLGLHDIMLKYPRSVLFGEDVAKKGGVYNVTNKLSDNFGRGRVFNTILDETMILGLGLGASSLGLLPIPEIQYLAYYHNAEDQIRSEACSLQFFSNNQFKNPMVMRIAGWAYQKGFGGHFHNDNSIAVLRDVPGLIIATPANGEDAVKMMRTCMALAQVDGRICAFLEPIALYMAKDLHEAKDGLWQFCYPAPGEYIPLGEGKVYNEDASDMTIITFANGLHMSLQAAKILKEEHNINVRVADIRWLNPINEEFIVEQVEKTGRVLIVDESRKTGSISESIMTTIYEHCNHAVKAKRLTGIDTYIPLAAAADLVLLQKEDIVNNCLAIMK